MLMNEEQIAAKELLEALVSALDSKGLRALLALPACAYLTGHILSLALLEEERTGGFEPQKVMLIFGANFQQGLNKGQEYAAEQMGEAFKADVMSEVASIFAGKPSEKAPASDDTT